MVFVGVISCDATSAWWHPSSLVMWVLGMNPCINEVIA